MRRCCIHFKQLNIIDYRAASNNLLRVRVTCFAAGVFLRDIATADLLITSYRKCKSLTKNISICKRLSDLILQIFLILSNLEADKFSLINQTRSMSCGLHKIWTNK